MSDSIEDLKREGKLRDQKVGFIQIEGLLKDAVIDIQAAKKVLTVSERGAFILAYQAMLKAGRALLFAQELRPADGAQHKTVVQASGIFLGKSFVSLAQHFETMRRKRNQLTYEYGALLSHSETLTALSDGENWIRGIREKVKEKNPQFELPF